MGPPSVLRRMLEVVGAAAGPARRPASVDATTPLFEGGFWFTSVDMLEVVLACEAEFVAGRMRAALDGDGSA